MIAIKEVKNQALRKKVRINLKTKKYMQIHPII